MQKTQRTRYWAGFILITLLFCMGATPQTKSSSEIKPSQTIANDKIIVYYFHGNYRCYSCMRIEQYTRESVEAAFAKELKSGQIEFKSINVDLPANSHYVDDYKLFTKSVIVSDMVQGKERRWKNLQKVWELLRNETKFKEYVKSETAAYLQEKRS
jgi:hypothetical protein